MVGFYGFVFLFLGFMHDVIVCCLVVFKYGCFLGRRGLDCFLLLVTSFMEKTSLGPLVKYIDHRYDSVQQTGVGSR